MLLAGENLITVQWIWLPLSTRQFCWYSLPPGGPAGRAALSKWGWFTCIPLWYVFLTLYTPMQCGAVPNTGTFLGWKNHFSILSVKYWLKPLCLFLLTTYWDTMGKETEAQRSNLAALCPIASFLLYDTTTF